LGNISAEVGTYPGAFTVKNGALSNWGAIISGTTGASGHAGGLTIQGQTGTVGFGVSIDSSKATLSVTGGNLFLAPSGVVQTNVPLNLDGTTAPLQLNGSAGTSGQVAISGGSGVTPGWAKITSSNTDNSTIYTTSNLPIKQMFGGCSGTVGAISGTKYYFGTSGAASASTCNAGGYVGQLMAAGGTITSIQVNGQTPSTATTTGGTINIAVLTYTGTAGDRTVSAKNEYLGCTLSAGTASAYTQCSSSSLNSGSGITFTAGQGIVFEYVPGQASDTTQNVSAAISYQ